MLKREFLNRKFLHAITQTKDCLSGWNGVRKGHCFYSCRGLRWAGLLQVGGLVECAGRLGQQIIKPDMKIFSDYAHYDIPAKSKI